MLSYRKEIDGLRAIAVLPVILFHGGISGFSGGYIGVDIFFVISGFLITSIIIGELNENRFSIINFYEKRARRILPALSVVLIVTTILAYIFMPADMLKSYSLSLASVSTFLSNVYFYLSSGYFSTLADEKPLLHTWSLAVEEQYYLFFPLMMVAVWKFGRKWMISIISVIAIMSLFLAQYLSVHDAVDANFYLIFSRAWELLFGSIIAFILTRKIHIRNWIRDVIGLLGLLMIVYAIIYFNNKTPFPSFYTLVPVIGTCLVIVFVNSSTYIGRLLSTKIFVGTGLISYSLYLWHQPFLAFVRMKSIGHPSLLLMLTAIVFTYVFAYISWKYIEAPFRNKLKFCRKQIFKFSAISTGCFLSIGLVGYYYNGFPKRFDVIKYADTVKYSPQRTKCHTRGLDYIPPNKACEYYGENITWAALGDSHIVEPAYALSKELEKSNEGLVHLSFSACPAALTLDLRNPPGCTKWFRESVKYIESNKSIENVLIGFRYSYHFFGDQLKSFPNIPNQNPEGNLTSNFRKIMSGSARQNYWKSLKKTILQLKKSGKNIYIIYPVPELPLNIRKAVMPFSVFSKKTMLDLDRSITTEYHFRRNKYIHRKLDSLPYDDKLHAIKPFDALCNAHYCSAVIDNKAMFADDDHLSTSGAEKIIGLIDF